MIVPMISCAETSTSADMLQVAPLKYEEKMNLGDVKEGTIDIMNPSNLDETIIVETSSFRMTNVTGQLEFFNSEETNSLEKFVTVTEKQFVLPAGSGKKIAFRLGVPISAPAGGYYGAIFFRIVPPNLSSDQSRAITSGRVGTVFFITVGQGDIRQSKITDFRTLTSPFNTKSKFEFEQINLGKYSTDPKGLYLKPTGILVIKNIFGQTKTEQKVVGGYVLPETARKIQQVVDNSYLFGIYKAELQISNYPGEQVETKTLTFVKLSPLPMIIFAFVVSMIFLATSLLKSISKKKSKKN